MPSCSFHSHTLLVIFAMRITQSWKKCSCVCVFFQPCQSQISLFKHLSLYLKLVAGQHNLLMFLWREESLKHWEVNWLTRWGELLHPLSSLFPRTSPPTTSKSYIISTLLPPLPPLPSFLPYYSQSLTPHLVTLMPPSLLPGLHFARGLRLTHLRKSWRVEFPWMSRWSPLTQWQDWLCSALHETCMRLFILSYVGFSLFGWLLFSLLTTGSNFNKAQFGIHLIVFRTHVLYWM